jgi:cytochrome c biogenesis protein CcmG/thiol:disulfide interchange protein DsbE
LNRNVLFVLFVVVAITVLLLVGKRASKPAESASAAAANGSAQSTPEQEQSVGGPAKGSAAPAFELKSIPDGKPIALASLHGKAVLLNFWATWCGPCKIEMPWLVDLQTKYGPQGLQIVGVAMDDTSDKEIADFAHKMGVNYVVLKGTEKVGDLYGGVEGLPTTYYLDRSGKVVDKTLGLAGESVIEDGIKKALAQGGN